MNDQKRREERKRRDDDGTDLSVPAIILPMIYDTPAPEPPSAPEPSYGGFDGGDSGGGGASSDY